MLPSCAASDFGGDVTIRGRFMSGLCKNVIKVSRTSALAPPSQVVSRTWFSQARSVAKARSGG
jgi:hypothetical protein